MGISAEYRTLLKTKLIGEATYDIDFLTNLNKFYMKNLNNLNNHFQNLQKVPQGYEISQMALKRTVYSMDKCISHLFTIHGLLQDSEMDFLESELNNLFEINKGIEKYTKKYLGGEK